MEKFDVVLTNYETGEVVNARITQGHYAFVAYKCPNLPVITRSLCMAYAAVEPSSTGLSGPELVSKACDHFTRWSYEEVADESGEDVPLETA